MRVESKGPGPTRALTSCCLRLTIPDTLQGCGNERGGGGGSEIQGAALGRKDVEKPLPAPCHAGDPAGVQEKKRKGRERVCCEDLPQAHCPQKQAQQVRNKIWARSVNTHLSM